MSPIGIIKPYFAENRFKICIGLLSLILVDGLQLIVPRIIKWAVDDLTAVNVTAGALGRYAAAVAGIAVLIGVFRYVWRLCLIGTSRRVEEGLRNRLFNHLQMLSAAYFDRTRTGDLMAHATNDIQQVRMAAGMGLVALNDAVVMGAAAIGFMAYINLTLTGLVLVPMPLIAVSARFFSRRMHRRYQSVQASFADLTEAIRERLAGIRLIKAHNRQTLETARVRAASASYMGENLRLVRVTAAFFPMMLLLTNLSMALVLFFGGRMVIRFAITPGDFVAFISYLALLTWPMMALGWVTNLIQRGRASLDRVNAILETRPAIQNAADARRLEAPRGEIVFEHVAFTYPQGGTPALADIDLRIEAGSVLGIVGPPGSGKTTLLSLIPRLYDPVAGSLRVDGCDVRRLCIEQLRAAIACLPQEPFLFAGTIRENITFGDPDVSEQRLIEATRSAALLETVNGLAQGFDTVIGERGVMLSGGQKQRVALARCLLADAPILLLDDPISQVDFETGEAITQALRRLAGRRTILIASHRISALAFADRIIVLEHGRITAAGRHSRLMDLSDYYARTYRLQEIEEGRDAA
ncbi:MAG: ABC transporter ATP-binding protein/permease [Desulfobacterales bacterium]|jgi:ATP-binding cassette subfamily B protein|nr:ABC transporter ATP-binding protein/permease [Desulfobacterales bacterium]